MAAVGATHATPQSLFVRGEHRYHPRLCRTGRTGRPQRREEALAEVAEVQSRRAHWLRAKLKTGRRMSCGRSRTRMSSTPIEYWRRCMYRGHHERGRKRSMTADPSRGGMGMRLKAARMTLA